MAPRLAAPLALLALALLGLILAPLRPAASDPYDRSVQRVLASLGSELPCPGDERPAPTGRLHCALVTSDGPASAQPVVTAVFSRLVELHGLPQRSLCEPDSACFSQQPDGAATLSVMLGDHVAFFAARPLGNGNYRVAGTVQPVTERKLPRGPLAALGLERRPSGHPTGHPAD